MTEVSELAMYRAACKAREEAIEECARVVFEAADRTVSYASVEQIAAAIRALKDKQ